jgi:hypothetical protein
MCEVGCTEWGIPESLVPRTVISIPNQGSTGTVWSVSALLGHRSMCLGLRCKVLNQSIVGLSPLSETAYSTGHDIP